MNQSDIADALIALISEKALPASLPHLVFLPDIIFYFGVVFLLFKKKTAQLGAKYATASNPSVKNIQKFNSANPYVAQRGQRSR